MLWYDATGGIVSGPEWQTTLMTWCGDVMLLWCFDAVLCCNALAWYCDVLLWFDALVYWCRVVVGQVASCVLTKDNGRYLPEWVAYHWALGVDEFDILDDDSVDDTREVRCRWHKKGAMYEFDAMTTTMPAHTADGSYKCPPAQGPTESCPILTLVQGWNICPHLSWNTKIHRWVAGGHVMCNNLPVHF